MVLLALGPVNNGVPARDRLDDELIKPWRRRRFPRTLHRATTMLDRSFLKAGHAPTLFSAFFYFDLSFMVWVLLGPLGVAIAKTFHLNPAEKGLMVAIPVLSGALLRLVAGVLVDHIGPKKTGLIGQVVVLTGSVSRGVALGPNTPRSSTS